MLNRAQMLQQTYAKTPLGQQAIATRAVPLLAAERRVLILIDGQRNGAELYQQLNLHNLFDMIAALEQQGLIYPMLSQSSVVTPPTPTPPPKPPQVIPSAASVLNEAALSEVKQLMINSSRQAMGLLATRLVRDIEDIKDLPSLKTTMARWNMALRESRAVAAQADQLLQTAKAMLPVAV
ncbi:hypothetical protein HZU75_14755 [Chitinibacter fontanus]|uniref:Uncharacterized protein n=1 Tax=Chitinibacter fontanus TaxID=1737446 RepID=A0A7D5ZEV6_9NEIS|nr:hypothetical protein [Chitinibacter fontanus]QLI82685.1 hypothetical protein HZU75_14755 [Chitinibacter fontanus]